MRTERTGTKRALRLLAYAIGVSILCCGFVSSAFGAFGAFGQADSGRKSNAAEAPPASPQQTGKEDPSKGKIVGLVTTRDGRPLAFARVIVVPMDACDELLGESGSGSCPLDKLGELVSTLVAEESLVRYVAELGGRLVMTDIEGVFAARNLEPGTYAMGVGRLGLRPVTQAGIPLAAGGIFEVRITLGEWIDDRER